MHISTPGGLTTGPAGGCSSSMCPNAATRVLVHRDPDNPGSPEVRLGAYCLPCMGKKVVPRQVYEAQILRSDASVPVHVPDDAWELRPFTDEEEAEVAAIHSGKLLCTYVQPGVWEWTRPA
ncbi:hypothetical protein [Streptomyces sp. NPDC049555]|uniref:hypothetical protein n=1 Tax=Streptomyces sp. NPDC049555 TaxID=3154930 RepID=UPI00342DE4F5